MSCLLEHSSSHLPIWLSIVCLEMRVFGDFATISNKIRDFPDDLDELMKSVLERLLREDETHVLNEVSL